MVYTEAFGPAAFIGRVRTVPLRNTGAALAPMNAFLLLQGLETLSLRMERHVDNALRVAHHLKHHPRWPGSATPVCRVTPLPAGGEVHGRSPLGHPLLRPGRTATRRACASTMPSRSSSGWSTSATPSPWPAHPASTTHRQLSEEEQAKAGVKPEMIRLSVGIEAIEDILADLDQALEA